MEKTIEKTSEEIGVAAEGLSKVTNEKEEVGHLLNKLCDQENELRSQAEHLIGVVETSHADSDNIHKRLDISRQDLQYHLSFIYDSKLYYNFN